MAKLGEVLGGIVRDVVQARVLADRMACESVRAYADDPLLAALPVPRVTLKDVTIKLHFAVDRVVEEDIQREAETEARELWKKELAAEILPKAFSSADPAVLKRLADAVMVAKVPDFRIGAALKGDAAAMLRASTAFITREIGRLPADARRKLRAVGPGIKGVLPEATEAFVKRVRDLVAAKAASRVELDVLVRKADLEKVPESGIHEFAFVLTMDDLHVTGQTGVPTSIKGGE